MKMVLVGDIFNASKIFFFFLLILETFRYCLVNLLCIFFLSFYSSFYLPVLFPQKSNVEKVMNQYDVLLLIFFSVKDLKNTMLIGIVFTYYKERRKKKHLTECIPYPTRKTPDFYVSSVSHCFFFHPPIS